MTELETERLLLRQWSTRDFDHYAGYYADADLARYVGGKMDRARAWRHMAALVGHWTLRGYGYWAVEEKRTQDFVGCVGLWLPEGWPELELGYWLVPDAQGRGYATEAANRAREYAFEVLGAKTLVSYVHPDNAASRKVAERLGAHYEKTIELLDHGPHSVYRYPTPAGY